MYQCSRCGKQVKSESGLKRHQNTCGEKLDEKEKENTKEEQGVNKSEVQNKRDERENNNEAEVKDCRLRNGGDRPILASDKRGNNKDDLSPPEEVEEIIETTTKGTTNEMEGLSDNVRRRIAKLRDAWKSTPDAEARHSIECQIKELER